MHNIFTIYEYDILIENCVLYISLLLIRLIFLLFKKHFNQALTIDAYKHYVTILNDRDEVRHFGSNKVRNILSLTKYFKLYP